MRIEVCERTGRHADAEQPRAAVNDDPEDVCGAQARRHWGNFVRGADSETLEQRAFNGFVSGCGDHMRSRAETSFAYRRVRAGRLAGFTQSRPMVVQSGSSGSRPRLEM